MRKTLIISLGSVALAAAGCGKHSSGGVSDKPPVPVTKLVGQGATSNLVTDSVGKHAAYIVGVASLDVTIPNVGTLPGVAMGGPLHVANSDGTDTLVTMHGVVGNYSVTPGGEGIFYLDYDPTVDGVGGTATINYLSLATAGAQPVPCITDGATLPQAVDQQGDVVYTPIGIGSNPSYSASGKYFLQASYPGMAASAPALTLFDVTNGSKVYDVGAGGDFYQQYFLSNDTFFFQYDTGGTANPTGDPTPAVQALYYLKLPGSTPTKIVEHSSSFSATADEKTLLILKTSGDLYTFDTTSMTLAGSPLATGVTSFFIGAGSDGPVAYVGSDKSVHVIDTKGKKLLDLDGATAGADLLSGPILSPDTKHVYFWQKYSPQDNQGTLLHAAVAAKSTPSVIATNVSIDDLKVLDQGIVFLDGLVQTGAPTDGTLGNVVSAALDGTQQVSYGMQANVHGLQVVQPSKSQWFALHLTGAMPDSDMTHTPAAGAAITGGLEFEGSDQKTALALDPTTSAAGFEFSDTGGTGLYIGGVSFNTAASNYAGELNFFLTTKPSTKVDSMLSGVTELGTVANRSLFVNAAANSAPGVYYVTY